MGRVVFPETGVARPDALDGVLPFEPPECLPPGFLETSEREFQATLIAFSFSASAFSSDS